MSRRENATGREQSRLALLAGEPLHALAFVRFPDEEIAAGIRGHDVCAVEVTGLMAGVSEGPHDFEGRPADEVDLLIGPVDHDEKRLVAVRGEDEIPDRPAAEGFLGDKSFLDERP